MEIRSVAVIGAGTMGAGIAHVFARYGRDVVLVDVSDAVLKAALASIEQNLGRQVKKGILTEAEAAAALKRVTVRTRYDGHVKDAELIIEAVTERREDKARIFEGIDKQAREDAILASNTSSISITWLASQTNRPERVIGMHFFNPAPVMELVEVVRGLQTSDATVERVRLLAEAIGKRPVIVQDSPGFVSNRVLMPMINEAIFCLMEGVATRDGIDDVMKLGMAHPMGPLALADLIGLDVCLHILEVLHDELRDDNYRPCPLLRKMVSAGFSSWS